MRPFNRCRAPALVPLTPALLSPVVAGLVTLAAATPAAATSFVMVSDRDLADRAPLIVTGRVLSGGAAVEPGGAPATAYAVAVEETVRGIAPGAVVEVRSPGGVRSDGLGLAIRGAPRFAAGERVLLFLKPDAGGGFRVLYLMLGAFHERWTPAGPVWQRELGEAVELPAPGRTPAAASWRGPRDRESFVAWLADRAAGVDREPDYFAAAAEGGVGDSGGEPTAASPAGPVPLPAGFTLLEHEGLHIRWFDFDTGGTVRWRVHEDGQPGLTLQQTLDAFGEGMAAWSSGIPNIIDYRYHSSQLTTATGGLTTFDDVNAIVFDDPNDNPDLDPDFSCATGGVLAIGGPWFSVTTQTWEGEDYRPTVGGDVVTNVGIDCFIAGSPNPVVAAAELYGHELGHTLGFGHSCGDSSSPSCTDPVLEDALMKAFIHNDGRGARINEDDRAACGALYLSQCALFLDDGFETGDLSGWSSSAP